MDLSLYEREEVIDVLQTTLSAIEAGCAIDQAVISADDNSVISINLIVAPARQAKVIPFPLRAV